MVQRTSERLNVEAGRTPEVAVQGSGRVGPQNTSGMFDNQVATKHGNFEPVPSGQLDPVVSALFGVGIKVSEALIEQQQQQAYLDGALAVGTIESEEQLETNLLTRQWAKAGYRDTLGRLALADYEAQISKDMPKLREMEPKQMQSYLQSKRRELQPMLQSMSQQARQQIFSQLVTSERASLAAHHKAHGEFIVQKTMQGLSTRASVLTKKMLDTGMPGAPGYQEAATALAAFVYGDIWNGPLPVEAKSKLIQELVEANMAQGDVSLYQFLQQANIAGPGEEARTLFNELPPDTQASLATKYHTAIGKHDFRINNQWWERDVAIRANLENPDAPRPSFNEYYAHRQQGVEIGAISPEAFASSVASYAKGLLDDTKRFDAVRAIATGQLGVLAANNTSIEKASGEYIAATVQEHGGSFAAALPTMIRTASNTGNKVLQSKIGEYSRASIQAIIDSTGVDTKGNREPPNPEQVAIIASLTSEIDKAQREGMRAQELTYYSGMTDQQKDFMLTVQEHVRNGSTPETAIARTREQFDSLKNLSPQEFQARRIQLDKEAREVFDGLQTRGYWASAAGIVGELFSSQIAANREISTTTFMGWSDEQLDGAYSRLNDELRYEFGELSRALTHLSPEALAKRAVMNVSSRTFKLEDGKGIMFLPRNADMHSVFNAPAVADKELITKAISKQIASAPELQGRDDLKYRVDVRDGQMTVQAFDPDGETGIGFTMDTAAVYGVGEEVRNEIRREDEYGNAVMGTGLVAKDPNTGATMNFNGVNGVGVRPENALEIRKSLYEFEGYRSKYYDDAGGQAIGIGFNNPKYKPKATDFDANGNLKPEVAQYLFYKASEDAMRSAQVAIQRNGLMNDVDAQKLLANFAYQSGVGFHSKDYGAGKGRVYQDLMQAMARGDEDAALKYLVQTPAYTAHKQNGYVNHNHKRNQFYVKAVRDYIRRHHK